MDSKVEAQSEYYKQQLPTEIHEKESCDAGTEPGQTINSVSRNNTVLKKQQKYQSFCSASAQ